MPVERPQILGGRAQPPALALIVPGPALDLISLPPSPKEFLFVHMGETEAQDVSSVLRFASGTWGIYTTLLKASRQNSP